MDGHIRGAPDPKRRRRRGRAFCTSGHRLENRCCATSSADRWPTASGVVTGRGRETRQEDARCKDGPPPHDIAGAIEGGTIRRRSRGKVSLWSGRNWGRGSLDPRPRCCADAVTFILLVGSSVEHENNCGGIADITHRRTRRLAAVPEPPPLTLRCSHARSLQAAR